MAQRSKPYTKKLALLDVFAFIVTGGGWLLIMAVRELYRWSRPSRSYI